MRRFRCATIATAWLLAGSAASAQQAPRFFGQALLSTATRTVEGSNAATGGVQATIRAGYRVKPGLGVVGEVSLASFDDEFAAVACPAGLPCANRVPTVSGLGVAGLAVGVQPLLHAGPVELLLTATAGEYWLYHRRSDMPATSPGVRGALGIGIPLSNRLHVLLEASAAQLVRQGVGDANTRQIGLGVALN